MCPSHFFLCLLFLCVLCFAHPVGVIGVDWWIASPFWAMNVVGMRSLLVQRLPIAASAESGP